VNFEEAMQAGRFREDLYHRLNEFTIRLPPLRDRLDDLSDLVDHLLKRIGQELGKPLAGLAPDAMRALEAYPWPGNIRELRNALKRAAVLADGPILRHHLPIELGTAAAAPPSRRPGAPRLRDAVRDAALAAERDLLVRTLEHTRWNRARAARLLGINYKTLHRKLREHHLGSSEPDPGR
jgi:two-component system response regulator FlrC